MKKYRVTVNGTAYEVELEEMTGSAAPAAAPADGRKITAPMSGTILAVNVAEGDPVKSGQVLMTLEAMKMENEIMAPCDGTIASVNTAKGTAVESGALLCVIR